MTMAKRFHWSSAARSDVGMVRKVNEDAHLELPQQGLWAVADGMGGHEAGDVASRMIIESLGQIPPPAAWEDFIADVQNRLHQVNRQLRQESAQRYHHRTIGSTVVVLLFHADRGACLWVGDSRLYRLRDDQLQLLTRDHSHVQELVDQGLISPEEAQEHPLGNVITRAVGSADELEVDSIDCAPQAGDLYLLCSDGLIKAVSELEIEQSLLAHGDLEETVQYLIEQALMRNATDNVTAIVVAVGAAAEETAALPTQSGPLQT